MRRWRRRRILIAAPFVVLLLWAGVSYPVWTLQPTSMTWSEHSAEWVRNDVPFGNWMVDQGEHAYYTANAPKTGGPQLKALPAVGLTPGADQRTDTDQRTNVTGRGLAPPGQTGLLASTARRRGLEAGWPAGQGWPTGAGHDLPPRARLPPDRR